MANETKKLNQTFETVNNTINTLANELVGSYSLPLLHKSNGSAINWIDLKPAANQLTITTSGSESTLGIHSDIITAITNKQDAITATNKLNADYINDSTSTNKFVTSELITKLNGISANAKKVEASETNGNIKIDGTETTVYTLPANVIQGAKYNGTQMSSTTDIPEVKTSIWDGKQGALNTEQLAACNSGITQSKVNDFEGYATDISTNTNNIAEINASAPMNSGITSAKVATYDGYADTINSKVAKNADITAGTKCKITYDAKGLVTSGADLAADDIPSLQLTKISDVTATAAELNVLDGMTSTTDELNVLDGITATTDELNYVDGVTSNIQTQLDGKQASLPTVVNDKYLHTNTTTGALEWSDINTEKPTFLSFSVNNVSPYFKRYDGNGVEITADSVTEDIVAYTANNWEPLYEYFRGKVFKLHDNDPAINSGGYTSTGLFTSSSVVSAEAPSEGLTMSEHLTTWFTVAGVDASNIDSLKVEVIGGKNSAVECTMKITMWTRDSNEYSLQICCTGSAFSHAYTSHGWRNVNERPTFFTFGASNSSPYFDRYDGNGDIIPADSVTTDIAAYNASNWKSTLYEYFRQTVFKMQTCTVGGDIVRKGPVACKGLFVNDNLYGTSHTDMSFSANLQAYFLNNHGPLSHLGQIDSYSVELLGGYLSSAESTMKIVVYTRAGCEYSLQICCQGTDGGEEKYITFGWLSPNHYSVSIDPRDEGLTYKYINIPKGGLNWYQWISNYPHGPYSFTCSGLTGYVYCGSEQLYDASGNDVKGSDSITPFAEYKFAK